MGNKEKTTNAGKSDNYEQNFEDSVPGSVEGGWEHVEEGNVDEGSSGNP